ncbi:MAG: hypothetical protein AMJ92_03250 [candidate division Zixibacteria bacterium SM23_81]|nr:MAG: hypothetical protein AMJ92_03250 [candidate division Zixibacteria bacterium SM23_81]
MAEKTPGEIVSVRDILFVVFKRQKMIIFVLVATVATVTIGVFLTKPVYEASAKVLINRGVSESELKMAPWLPSLRALELEEAINSEIELITSRAVLEAVVDRLDQKALTQEPSASQETSQDSTSRVEGGEGDTEKSRLRKIMALRRSVIAEPVKRSDVIQIRYRSQDPQQAIEVTNTVAEAYIDYRAMIYRTRGAVDFFDEQIELAKRNLDELESALRNYRQQEAVLSYDEQSKMLLRKLNEFETSLTEVRKDIISKETKLSKIRDFMSSPLQPLIPSLEMREEKIISELHDRFIDLRLRLNELLTKYTEDHREVLQLRREIALGEADLRIEVEKVIELEESSLEALRAEEDALRTTVTMLYKQVRALPEKELTIEQLQRAIENHKEVYSMLMLKREEARISEASDRRIVNVSVISPATLPLKPVKPQRKLLIFSGFLIGLVGGFGLAFALEYLDHSLRTSEDVEHYLGLPVLASIPDMKQD